MSRYIDADALIDFLDIGHLRHTDELSFSEVEVANLLLHAPKADAVLVARCCDCNNRNDEEKCPLCHVEYKTMFDYKTDDNGFCHKWERRADDVAPVVHGRWVCIDTDTEQFFVCSKCGNKEYWESDYCPNCGSRMDGNEGESDGTKS